MEVRGWTRTALLGAGAMAGVFAAKYIGDVPQSNKNTFIMALGGFFGVLLTAWAIHIAKTAR